MCGRRSRAEPRSDETWRRHVGVGFPEHSLPPSRAFYWIDRQDPARAVAFAKLAYRKYWLQGCPTSDAAVAVDVAVSIGYDMNAVREGMQSAETKDRLVSENEEAIRRGVFGSPFFIMDGEPFWGSDRISLTHDNPGHDA